MRFIQNGDIRTSARVTVQFKYICSLSLARRPKGVLLVVNPENTILSPNHRLINGMMGETMSGLATNAAILWSGRRAGVSNGRSTTSIE